jgi:8-oxo-dGTP pyrophosphatase MutT (NUDIX family)
MLDFNQLTPADIAASLQIPSPSSYDVPSLANLAYRDAGVLIPFVRVAQAWHLLFIRRPHYEGDMHSGQVAFAGGKRDPEDKTLIDTALREAYEELGIQAEDVNVLGQLRPHFSISQFRITPTVAIMPWPYALVPSPDEVAHSFTMPLNWLANPANYQVHYKSLPSASAETIPVIYFKDYQGELLWGATARMVLSLIECLTRQHAFALD